MATGINIDPSISLGAKPPAVMSLSDMLNIARGGQAYRQAEEIMPLQLQRERQIVEQAAQVNPLQLRREQQLTRTGDINLGVAETEEQERRIIQQLSADPNNFFTDGRFDITKANRLLSTAAPMTGRKYIAEMTELQTAQTAGDEAKTGLDTGIRSIIGSRIGVLGRVGITDKNAYLAELDLIAEQYPDNDRVQTLVNSYKTQLNPMQGNDPTLPQVAIREAESLLTPSEAQSAFAPKPATADTGGAIQPVVTTPSVGGSTPSVAASGTAIPKTLEPGQRVVPTGRVDPISNVPTAFVYGADGRLLGEVPITSTGAGASLVGPGGGSGTAPRTSQPPPATSGANRPPPNAAPATPLGSPLGANPARDQLNQSFANRQQPGVVNRIPAGETPASMAALIDLRENSNKIAATIPEQFFNYTEMIKLADQAVTGRGAETIANLTGGFAAIPLGGDMATDLQTLGHYMKNQTAVLATTSGMNTDAARSISEAQVGTTNWTPAAIKNTARVNRALARGSQMFNQGLENVIAQNSGNIFAGRDYRNQWGNAMDINALRLHDAMESRDAEGLAAAVRSMGGIESQKYKDAKAKIATLKSLAGQ
jgi:hypothetical protein